MTDYDNTNRGVAFANDKKESDSHPDMKGSINIEGVEYWLSAWWKTPRNGGEDFLSFSVKPKEAPRAAAPKQHPVARRGRPQPAQQQADDDSDVPF
jgi:uncharacterized protein (DUF736 family)